MNYIIKKELGGSGLILLNERGCEVRTTDILHECGTRRVFAFEGKMGAGKTTFIKQLCQDLGTNDIVNSPTFALVNVYDVGGDVPYVYHFDCYRVKDISEAINFGAEDYLYSGNYCFIEWPDIIAPLLPDDTVYISITEQPDTTRQLTINNL